MAGNNSLSLSRRPGRDTFLIPRPKNDPVWKLDRLPGSLKDVRHIMERIAQAGAGFYSLTENIDTTTPGGPDDDADGGVVGGVWARHGQGRNLRWRRGGSRRATSRRSG